MKTLLLVISLLLAGCSSPSMANSTLQKAGYTNIKTTGYSWFSCSDSDTFATGFIADNPKGHRISGTVCCGWLVKACTIRF